VEVYVELHRYNVLIEISHKQISDSPENSGHAFLLKPFDEKLMMNSDTLGHHIDDRLSNNSLLADAENLARDFVAIDKTADRLIVIIRKNSESNIVDVIH
jgi:hypothetical protein